MVFHSLIRFAVGKRVPSIKFRKGGNVVHPGASTVASSNQASASPPAPATKAGSRPVIEDWELPPRYARKQIGSLEMDYINRGGPD